MRAAQTAVENARLLVIRIVSVAAARCAGRNGVDKPSLLRRSIRKTWISGSLDFPEAWISRNLDSKNLDSKNLDLLELGSRNDDIAFAAQRASGLRGFCTAAQLYARRAGTARHPGSRQSASQRPGREAGRAAFSQASARAGAHR